MSILKAALAGRGMAARLQAKAIHLIDELEIVGVLSSRKENADKFIFEQSLAKAKGFEVLDQMLDVVSPDILIISTPPNQHLNIIRTACDYGVHIFSEKPLTLNLDQARDACGLVDAKPHLVHGCAFVHRVQPQVIYLKRLVAEGALGAPLFAQGEFLTYFSDRSETSWRLDPEQLPSGVLADFIPHLLDLSYDLMSGVCGEIIQARGLLGVMPANRKISEDLACVNLLFNDRMSMASLTASRVHHKRISLTLSGSEGSAAYHIHDQEHIYMTHKDDPHAFLQKRPIPKDILAAWHIYPHSGLDIPNAISRLMFTGYYHLLKAFAQAVLKGGGFAPSFKDGLRVHEIMATILNSQKHNGEPYS